MESTRDKAVKIVELVNEQTNVYDAIDVVTDALQPLSSPDIRYYKGKAYEVLSEGEMKNPENGNWQKCIHYKSVAKGKLYTREATDFNNKFSTNET